MNLNVFAIKLLIAESELSFAKLAEKAGVDRSALYNTIRKGTCTPRTAGKIAHALGVSVADIVTRE